MVAGCKHTSQSRFCVTAPHSCDQLCRRDTGRVCPLAPERYGAAAAVAGCRCQHSACSLGLASLPHGTSKRPLLLVSCGWCMRIARAVPSVSHSATRLVKPRPCRVHACRARAMAASLPLRHVFLPATSSTAGRPPPLLVLLHGTGADEHDLLDCGREAQEAFCGELAVASVRAPLRAQWGGHAWFEGFSAAPERRALEHTVRGAASSRAGCSHTQRFDAGPYRQRIQSGRLPRGCACGVRNRS